MNASDLYKNLDDDSRQQINRLAQEIKDQYSKGDKVGQYKGKVILFLGAAVNYHAPAGFEVAYSKTDRPPLGSELTNLYIDDYCAADVTPDRKNRMKEDRLSLSWVSQLYEAKFDRRTLVKKLSGFIGNKKTSPILKALAKMHFKYIVTTNYDNLFEDALSVSGKKDFHNGTYKANDKGGSKYTEDVDEAAVTVDKPFFYKLHGDISEVFNADDDYLDENDSIVLTDEDYLNFILRMSQVKDNKERDISEHDFYPIPQSINKAFNGLNANTFLFVGYGLRDYNLRLIFKTALWKKDKNVFQKLQKWSIDTKPDEGIKNIYINQYKFTFIEHDIWNVIPYLYKVLFNEEMPLV